jgi:hypothetical protein
MFAAIVATAVVSLLAATASPAHATAGVAHASAASHPLYGHVLECKRGYYKNSSGRCVHSPSSDPTGATAKCRDGTYSYSQHASGTCSHHGGVDRWIHHP